MDIKNPQGNELVELIDKISAAFSYNKEEEGVGRDFPQLYDPKNSQHLWMVKEGQTIAAHSGFYPATMKVEGVPLPVAGIGGVFTSQEYQGQGLASLLVNKCTEEAGREGAALAFLWSDQHEFYSKLGFHLVGRQWTIPLDPSHTKSLEDRGAKSGIQPGSLRMSEGEITPEFLAASYSLQQNLDVGIARSPEEHALLLGSGSCRIFSAWAGNELGAYFVIGKGKDLQNYVHEWAGEEGALHQLAAHCLKTFGHTLYVLSPQFMPDEVNWIYSLDQMGISLRAERMALVKLLSFPKVQRLMADYMGRMGLDPSELRLSQGPQGNYGVEWRKQTRLTFDEPAFLKFLFGPEMPAHPELKGFLPLRLWYWGMDSV